MGRAYAWAVTDDAEQDIEGIEEYVASYADADFVDALLDAFELAFDDLCANPYARPVYQFEPPAPTLHDYRSVNVYNYKVFYWVDEEAGLVVIYRIRHVVSDFSRMSL